MEDDCACAEILSSVGDQFALELENDCACVDAPLTEQMSVPGLGLYHRAPGLICSDLLEDYRLVLSTGSQTGPVVINQAAWEVLEGFGTPHRVSMPVERDMVRTGLLLPAEQEKFSVPSEPHTLTAWLHITNACNLDCPYCYVRKSSETMSYETGIQAIGGLFRTAGQRGFRQVKIKYAGGEATLHFDLVRSLHEEAKRLSEDLEIGLHEVVLSNGTHLSEEDALWLRENNIRLMISLDGVGAVHDQTRLNLGGKGTFSRIERIVDKVLLPNGVRPSISITVTALNAGGIADTVRWVLERGLPLSINFYRQPSDSAARADLDLEEKQIIAGMEAAYQVFEEYLPETPFLNGLLDRVRVGAHQRTCGVGQSYLVINHEGKLAPCHMQVNQAVGVDLGHDLLGQLSRDKIGNLPVEQKTDCRNCSYRYFCAGGCPLETFRAAGRWDAPGPNCSIYRALIPQALRLEGLRLLKTYRRM